MLNVVKSRLAGVRNEFILLALRSRVERSGERCRRTKNPKTRLDFTVKKRKKVVDTCIILVYYVVFRIGVLIIAGIKGQNRFLCLCAQTGLLPAKKYNR